MPRIRVAACQINTVVGDLDGNVDRIGVALAEAERARADLAVFPELAVTGYPPEDLLGRPAFVEDNLAAFAAVAAATRECAAVVGYVDVAPSGRLLNAVALCHRGEVLGRYVKRILPNYGVFDEQRWFAAGAGPVPLLVVAGVPVGMTVCEDMWFPSGPMADQAAAGARLLVNANASPYSRGRREERLEVLAARAAETGCAIVYVNQVGGQDELVFDGASVVIGADGDLLASAGQFVEEVLVCDLEFPDGPVTTGTRPVAVSSASRAPGGVPARPVAPVLDPVAEVYEALVLGTRDYLGKNGFSDAVIGLSGGIDSSLVAAVAVDAVGAGHVHGVAMPSRYSSEGSLSDAEALAAALGIDLARAPIEQAHRALGDTLAPLLGGDPTDPTQPHVTGAAALILSVVDFAAVDRLLGPAKWPGRRNKDPVGGRAQTATV